MRNIPVRAKLKDGSFGTLMMTEAEWHAWDASGRPADTVHDFIKEPGLTTGADDLPERVQKFFADLALEMRKPHFGEHAKIFTMALLNRAQEAHLYTPEAT